MTWAAAARRATALGAIAGAIISVAALGRGFVRWSSTTIPFAAIALLTSFVTIIVVMNVIAATTFYGQRRTSRAAG